MICFEIIQIYSDSKQFLALSEIYYPYGWTVKNDNNDEFKIYEVNGLIRGIFVPKGKHIFTMTFNPQDIFYAKIISFSSLFVIFMLLLLHYYKRENNV